MSQRGSAKGAAFQLSMNDSSDDELPFHNFKFSALTSALLEKDNLLHETTKSQRYQTRQHELSLNYIGDNVERQPKSNAARPNRKIQSPNAIGRGLSELDNKQPRRIVRVSSKAPGTPTASVRGQSQYSPQLSDMSAERLQLDGIIPGKLVTPSAIYHSSKLEAAKPDSSGSGYQRRSRLGSGGGGSGNIIRTAAVERITLSRDLQRSTSTLLKSTTGEGTAVHGPARRFRRTERIEPSPGDKIIYPYGTRGVEQPEHQSERYDKAPPVHGTDQLQSQDMASKCSNTDRLDIRNLENHNIPSGHGQENGQSSDVLQYKKSMAGHLDKYTHPELGQNENQSDTPDIASTKHKALGDLRINNYHLPAAPPKMSILEMATKSAGAATASNDRKKRIQMTINKKPYQRLECIGRGGSCRVYRVMSENNRVWALKKVSLVGVDEQAVVGFRGEIDLLTKLAKVDRVVQLIDWELNEAKQTLSVLMECGEVDLDSIIKRHIGIEHPKFDAGFTQFYWKEILSCVAAIHHHDVVHSDLKPANFLLVNGSLKLIDFGIANAIQDDTINVHREHQVGTPNFMAPEALTFTIADTAQPNGTGKLVKIGKPSDIWSLGCILYLMLYGEAPFAQCRGNLQKAMLITNPHHAIAYPSTGIGGAHVPSRCIETLKVCLSRDQFHRPVIETLLGGADQLLFPGDETGSKIAPNHERSGGISEEQLGVILQSVVRHCRASGLPTDPEVVAWQKYFYENIKLASAAETDLNAGLKTITG